jgi:hypothetical protein
VKPSLEDDTELGPPVTEVEPETPPEPEPAPPQMPEPELKIEPETPAPPEAPIETAIETEAESETAPPAEPVEASEEAGPVAITDEKAEPVAITDEEAEPVAVTDEKAEPAAEAEPEVETMPASSPVAAQALDLNSATGIIEVTVEELNATLTADKAGANGKLMDKALKVTGNVDKVFVRDNLDIYYIILAGAGGPSTWQVRCTFNQDQSAYLSRLTEGQKATVQGTYVGYERNIILKECSLVH